ncbi:hypothetical protein [Mucilaginibacter terrae]|uniref:Molybdopterin-binding protein n=1 Tax=Mucilaginibacter terrae TaxID=1955052 RepID=A0ABU3GU01_9SPHI|nr:hypothetical protein [Mucilaginibacter terrae]MDT3403135.1 hypothetical protein [Mucilaginibacter terrae]
MKQKLLVLLIVMAVLSFGSKAQNITISGKGINSFNFTKAMFANLKPVVLMAKGHDEKVHRYTGVALADVLKNSGVILGDSAKKKTIVSYIIVTAADNYKAIYTLPEIDPLFANRTIILANKVDKQLLPEGYAPYQIIVPGERKHARWLRQVVSIELVTVQ